ncbi:hypothetical protein SADUNF_Sadunf15G0100100 [Salix dunnii]|uniref:Uncharacterized protein n=1 Tax=Salix dunnii TaxID=1413687 RepID=A0A835JEZ9_9ROSI|nr:hypothetical protein SADUNF_Sadunf15G0100100 [Salix dunnii]
MSWQHGLRRPISATGSVSAVLLVNATGLEVRTLNLSNIGLLGTFPPPLGNLSFLATFDIRNNSFHGYLPDELEQLLHLRMQRQQSKRNGSFEIG